MNTPSTVARSALFKASSITIKIGSRVLTGPDGCLDVQRIGSVSRQIANLVASGKKIVLVSSGAVSSGVSKLGLSGRPKSLAKLQAVAAVGQAQLIQFYESFLSSYGLHAAQILLTAEDLEDRRRYLHVRNTLRASLEMGLVPILNENDSVAVEELQTTFGDNDRLAASVACAIDSDVLIILSDVEGVYDRDPDLPGASILPTVEHIDQSVFKVASAKKSDVGRGGMQSKLNAANLATRSGVAVVIAGGRVDRVVERLLAGEEIGTYFRPNDRGLAPRKRWIGSTQCAGKLHVDAGAVRAIQSRGPSLLAIGILGCDGSFECGDVVSIIAPDGVELARGLSNFSSQDVHQIRGLHSDEVAKLFQRSTFNEVVHRDNMVIFGD